MDWGHEKPVWGAEASGAGEEGEEKADVTPHKLATTLFCIMTFLATVTVAFEKGKEYLIENVADRNTRPVIAGLFSELTVLGFLSLVTFVISQLDILSKISARVFGEGKEREEYLTELLEQIHFIIFAVMVIFIGQSLILLKITKHQIKTWTKCQEICSGENPNKRKDINNIIDWLAQEEAGAENSCWGWQHARNWCLGRNERHREMLDVLRFDAMREEFITPRSQFPPFDGIEKERLPANFDYAKYMQKQLTDFLVEIIEVPVSTWCVVWVLSAGFVGVMLAVDDDPKLLAWIWTGFGYVMVLAHNAFQLHINRTLSM